MQNSHPFKVMQKDNHVDLEYSSMVSCISHMDPTLNKVIGCVTVVIKLLC